MNKFEYLIDNLRELDLMKKTLIQTAKSELEGKKVNYKDLEWEIVQVTELNVLDLEYIYLRISTVLEGSVKYSDVVCYHWVKDSIHE